MIIEAAAHLTKYKLMNMPDCSTMREEQFTNLLSSACKNVLSHLGIPDWEHMVQVEFPYLQHREKEKMHGSIRCDLVLKTSLLPYDNVWSSHKIFVECKYFRATTTDVKNSYAERERSVNSLWSDFRKVIKSYSIAYSVVLCEEDYKLVLTENGDHAQAVKLCFDPKSSSKFSLWDSKTEFEDGSVGPLYTTQKDPNGVEIEIVRNITEPILLKMGSETRKFRIYIYIICSQRE